MSTPLQVALEIAGAISRSHATHLPLDVAATSRVISERHSSAGYSRDVIAQTLAEEGVAAGVPLLVASRRVAAPGQAPLA